MPTALTQAPTLADIRAAHQRIKDKINHTPVMTSSTLNELCGAQLFFKCENFQKIGAFKARGAANAVFSLSAEAAERGVATHSSGNHAAALARAARLRGIAAHIVMPEDAPRTKIESVQRQGGLITFCVPTLEARETGTAKIIAETGATLVHPYDNYEVIAGQGTAALELLGDVPELDFIMAPVGGGGLLSGTAIAAKAMCAGVKVIAAEPEAADDARRSFLAGRLIPLGQCSTIADGLRTSLSDKTFAIIQSQVDDIITVSEASIVRAMRMVWQVMKIIIEPSCALPLAVLLDNKLPASKGQRVGIILTGGNVDLDKLPWQGAQS